MNKNYFYFTYKNGILFIREVTFMADTRNIPEEKEIVLAFFDILGSSKRLMDNEYQKVYEFYQYMVKLCSETEVPLSSPGILPHERGKEILILHPMHHAFFSDTFILWVEYDEFLQPRMGGFYEKCSTIFIEAIKKGIPLRGSIARGTAIMDEENKLFLGKPLAEAAKAEPAQQWLGIGITKSCENIYPTEARYMFPFKEHIKQGKESLLSLAVLDWARYFRETENYDPTKHIDQMNTDNKFSIYYETTKKYIKSSKEHNDFMKPLEDTAPPVIPLIVLKK